MSSHTAEAHSRGRGGRGGGRGRARAGDADSARNTRFSKSLSWALRHGAVELGFHVRPDGFVAVTEVLAIPQVRGLDMDTLRHIVATCPKQRFKLIEEDGVAYIRANQGHTIRGVVDDAALLRPVTTADGMGDVVHGTYMRHWHNIAENGLARMSRNHVHFAELAVSTDAAAASALDSVPLHSADPDDAADGADRPAPAAAAVTDEMRAASGSTTGKSELAEHCVSGMRSSVQVHVYLDVAALLRDGIPVWRSENGVILCSGLPETGIIPPKYIKKAIRVRDNAVLWPLSDATATARPDSPPAVA